MTPIQRLIQRNYTATRKGYTIKRIVLHTYGGAGTSKFFKDAGQITLAWGFLLMAVWFSRQVVLRLIIDGIGFSNALNPIERVEAINTLTQPIYSIPFNFVLIIGILIAFYELVRLYKLCK